MIIHTTKNVATIPLGKEILAKIYTRPKTNYCCNSMYKIVYIKNIIEKYNIVVISLMGIDGDGEFL